MTKNILSVSRVSSVWPFSPIDGVLIPERAFETGYFIGTPESYWSVINKAKRTSGKGFDSDEGI
jgi:hypothetical protein